MKENIKDFLDVLETESKQTVEVKVSSKKTVEVKPLTFKQQKMLVTSGFNGISGVMKFIKNLNEIIMYNSGEDDLKIYDRVPIAIALRKHSSDKPIEVDENVKVKLEDLEKQFRKFNLKEDKTVEGEGYKINLKIPTLKEENRSITMCMEDLKTTDEEDLSKNISLILTYEIPKFVDTIVFGKDNEIEMKSLSLSDRIKILDNLPAEVTNEIMDFIIQVRNYDEELLTYDGVLVEIDSNFFE